MRIYLLLLFLCVSLMAAPPGEKTEKAAGEKAKPASAENRKPTDVEKIEETLTTTFDRVWAQIDETVRGLFKQADEASK